MDMPDPDAVVASAVDEEDVMAVGSEVGRRLVVTEKEWQRTVVEAASVLGWSCYHTHDSRRSNAGFPDLVLVHPDYGVVYMELKSTRGRPSPAQNQWIALLQTVGECAGVFWPDDWEFVERILKGEIGTSKRNEFKALIADDRQFVFDPVEQVRSGAAAGWVRVEMELMEAIP